MTSRRQKRTKAHKRRRSPSTEYRAEAGRPSAVQAIEDKHAELRNRLAQRPDRFSQLAAKVLADERAGQRLVSRGGLSDAERTELLALRQDAHRGFRDELADSTRALRGLLAEGEPLHTVAVVQAANIMTTWGGYYEPTASGGENRVELVASLLASQATHAREPLDGWQIQEVNERIEQIVDIQYLLNLSYGQSGDADMAAVRFSGAMQWTTIRGTSYAEHGRDLAMNLFKPFAAWLRSKYGFTVDDVLAVADAAEACLTEAVNALGAKATEAAAASAGATLDERGVEMARARFVEVFTLGIREAATFTMDALCARAPLLDRARVRCVLHELSIAVASLDETAYSGLFDPSPLIERPVLRHGDRYLLPVPGMLSRETVAVLDGRLMRGAKGYSKSRAQVLDTLAVQWLSVALGEEARCYTNLFYDDAELDGLVLFEDLAFVIEGKGSSISVPARRGDVERLVNEIRNGVERALEQAVRARDFILKDGDSVFFNGKGEELVRTPHDAIREVRIVNPTIQELAGFAPQLGRFRSQGLFRRGELPWSVYINDLRVIAETAENAAVFLHYLVWRDRLALGTEVIVSDELDLWGSYLFGARFEPLGGKGVHHVANSSTDFDAYYDGLADRGPRRATPRKYLDEPASSFVTRIATERPRGWREASGVVLDLSIPELAFVCARAGRAGRDASTYRRAVEYRFGRGVLIGVPWSWDLADVRAYARADRGDASFFVYARAEGQRVEIVHARYGAEVSLALSDFEIAMNAAAPSPFSRR